MTESRPPPGPRAGLRGRTTVALATLVVALGVLRAVQCAGPGPQGQELADPSPASDPAPPARRALIVGVSRYPEKTGWVPLPGAKRDATLFADLLQERFEFQQEDIRLLLDEEATREAITRGFQEWLVDDAGENTQAVFYFAGHGSRVFDEEEVEPDYRDETLVPFDALGPDDARQDVRDDELRVLFQDLSKRTEHVVGIFDCCHSGTANRDVAVRYVAREVPEYVPEGSPEPPLLPADPSHSERVVDLAGARRQPTILSACLDFQSALEDTQRGRGVFSWMLEQALRNAPTDATWSLVADQVRRQMRELGVDQEPFFQGPAATKVFGGQYRRTRVTFLTEEYHKDKGIRVRGGVLHGFEPGTLVQLVPITRSEKTSVVPAEVESAGLSTSVVRPQGEVTQFERKAINGHGYVAEILERPGPPFGLSVFAAERDDLAQQVLTQILETEDFRAANSSGEAGLRLIPGTEDLEAFLDSGAQLLPHPMRRSAATPSAWRNHPRLIADDLQAYARWRYVRSLVNAASSLSEHVTLEVVPLWESPTGELQAEDPLWVRGARGEWLLGLRDEEDRRTEQGGGLSILNCILRSSHERPLYVLALNLLPDWSVVVVPQDWVVDPDQELPITLEAEAAAWVDGCVPEQVVFFLSEDPMPLTWESSAGLRTPEELGLEPLKGIAQRGIGGGRVASRLNGIAGGGALRSVPSGADRILPWTTLSVDFSILPIEAGSLKK